MIPYFLLALFSHLNSAFRRVPSAVTPFPINSPNSFYWLYIISPQWNDTSHDDIMKWKYFPHYRPFVRGIHQSLVDSLYKGPAMWNFWFFFMSAQTSCSTNIHPTNYLRWWRSCDISVMNSWNNTLQRKKDEVLCFRPLLYLLKWTRALPETKKCMCEPHSHLGPEISSHYLVDGSLEHYLRTRANAFLQWK